MLAKHLRMLSVFAGGCLSGSVLIVVWRGGVEPSASNARRAATQNEPAVAIVLDEGRPAADEEASPHEETEPATPSPPAAPKPAERGAETATTEPGRAVANVLAHLEAAYRQKLAETSPPTGTPPQAEAPAPANAPSADSPSPEAAPAHPMNAALAQAPSREAPAREPPSMALAAVAAPSVPMAAVATQNPAPPTASPSVAAVPPAQPVSVVPQNVHIGDTHNGNTYQVQQIIQYVPMYSPWAYGGYVPPSAPTQRGGGQKRVPYPSTLTNPDNPWGYDFPSALWTVR